MDFDPIWDVDEEDEEDDSVPFEDIKPYSVRGKMKMAKTKDSSKAVVIDSVTEISKYIQDEVAKRMSKPKLLHIGEHFISPEDIAGIKKASAKKDLYILILKSQPNPEWPIWVSGKDINALLENFEVITHD